MLAPLQFFTPQINCCVLWSVDQNKLSDEPHFHLPCSTLHHCLALKISPLAVAFYGMGRRAKDPEDREELMLYMIKNEGAARLPCKEKARDQQTHRGCVTSCCTADAITPLGLHIAIFNSFYLNIMYFTYYPFKGSVNHN